MCEHGFLVSQLFLYVFSFSLLFSFLLVHFGHFFFPADKRQLPHINMVNIHAEYKHKTLQKLPKNYQSSFHWNWTVLNSHHTTSRIHEYEQRQLHYKRRQPSTRQLNLKRAPRTRYRREIDRTQKKITETATASTKNKAIYRNSLSIINWLLNYQRPQWNKRGKRHNTRQQQP